jgi:mannitol-1-phosphate/altronate dehydrogenase
VEFVAMTKLDEDLTPLGYLAGYEYIYKVMQKPVFVTSVQRLMPEEARPRKGAQ